VVGKGSYEDYLEGRLSPFVRSSPHWAAKGVTHVELGALAQAIGVNPKFECPLFAHPSAGASLLDLRVELISQLASLDEKALQAVSEKWAATMSTPEHTHSVTGVKLNDGWTPTDALAILLPIAALARQAGDGQRMYLLLEY
jgi:hypothetical protein